MFHFCFIKASRPLDDVERLPDELLKPIQEKKIDKTVRDTSLKSLKDTINALEQTNGGKSGELMLDMQVTEDDISELLQRITTATYNVDGYYLGESSQGLGYSNMIYIHLQLKEYEKGVDPLKVNMFFLEEPESHMHPQMQQVFIKYLMDYYHTKLQGLITTHSNEMLRTVGLSHLRVIRHAGNFKSKLYDLSTLLKDLKKSENLSDKELANFFDWFFEIGYSEIVFADKAIFYEGDTERLFIRKAMTLEKYKKLSQQYVAFIQVGGAYAKNYEKLIRLLGIKSLIITDIDYEKEKFAKLLPDECYDFPNKELDIQAGTSKVMFPIYLKNLERISPDSIYFLDYKIDPKKTPNYNPDKSHVLLRIYKENYYATTKTSTYYNYTSSTIVIPNPSGSPEVRRPTNANQVFPIGANSVRMMAGDEDLGDYKTARSRIVSKSIILEIGEQQPENPQARELTIRAHDRVNDVEVDPVDVVQLTPIDDYDNTFLLNAIRTPDGRATYYKEFRLHYKYRLESTAPYREVKAKLRYEFNPRVDNL